MNRSRRMQAGFTWLELLAVLVIIVLVAGVIAVLSTLIPRSGSRHRPSCQNSLKVFGLVMKMYSGESRQELFPPLSPYASVGSDGQTSPRFAAYDVSTVCPEYLTDMEISKCPTDPDTAQSWWDKKIGRKPEADAFNALQASAQAAGDAVSLEYYSTAQLARSYVYLGCATTNVPEFHGWLGATSLLPVTGSVQVAGVGDVPLKDFSGDLTVEPAGWPAWVPFPDHEAGIKAKAAPGAGTSLPEIYRLREGVERHYVQDDANPDSAMEMQTVMPIMWDAYGSHTPGGPVDRFNHEPAGCNVLYCDGHVEFVRYPGKFPIVADRIMTDYLGQQGKG